MKSCLLFPFFFVTFGVMHAQMSGSVNVAGARAQPSQVERIVSSAGGQMIFHDSARTVMPDVTYVFGKDTSVWHASPSPLSLKTVSGHALVNFDSIRCNAQGYMCDMLMLNAQGKQSRVHCDYDTDGFLQRFTCMYNSKHGITTQLFWAHGCLMKSVYYECNDDSLKQVGSMTFDYAANASANVYGLYYPNQYLDIELFNPLLYAGLMGRCPDKIPTSYEICIDKKVSRTRVSVWHDKQGRVERITENSYDGGFNTKETISFSYR